MYYTRREKLKVQIFFIFQTKHSHNNLKLKVHKKVQISF